MRFDHIRIKDLGPFDEVDLDLAALSGKLVAVCGDNGAGKSTLLELLPGALFRTTDTRGSLTELATSRHAMVEVTAVNGAAYTVRQLVDAVSGKGEALILDAAGEPQTSTGKVRDADAWVRSHFPAAEVLYTSTFLSQQSEGFLELPAGERKEVLLRLLQNGIDKLEAYAQAARERVRSARQELETARAMRVLLLKRYPVLADAKQALEAAEQDLARWTETVRVARANLDEGRQQAALAARADEIRAQRAALVGRVTEATLRLGDVQERIKNNRWLLGRADELRAAVARLELLRAERDRTQQEAAAAKAALLAAHDREYQVVASAARAVRVRDASAARYQTARARAADVTKVRRAVNALPAAKAKVDAAIKAISELNDKIEAAEQTLVTGKDDRIKGLRTGLEAIATAKGKHHRAADQELAVGTLGKDDDAKRAQQRAPAAIERLRKQLEAAHEHEAVVSMEHVALKETAARAKDLEKAETELRSARAELEELEQDVKTGEAEVRAVKLEVEQAQTASQAAADAHAINVRAVIEHEPKCLHADKLEVAQAKLEEWEPQAAQLQEAIAADQTALEALTVPDAKSVDVLALVDYLAQCEDEETECRDRVVHCRMQVTSAQEGEGFLTESAAEIARCEQLVENWTRLSLDCGKEGIQAFVIDSCLPELNELANDLLHACFGSRYTIELRSSRDSADGHRQLEDLGIHVIDSVEGFAGPAERYSGGQRVILGEAVALALTMLACRIAGLSRPTLVRDESGAALAPANARAYVTMLRRAAQVVQADKVLFVSHNPELQSLADARIEVKDGTAVVAHD